MRIIVVLLLNNCVSNKSNSAAFTEKIVAVIMARVNINFFIVSLIFFISCLCLGRLKYFLPYLSCHLFLNLL